MSKKQKMQERAVRQADKNIANRHAAAEPNTTAATPETKSQKVVDSPASSPVDSGTTSEAGPVNSVAGEKKAMTIVFTRTNPDRKGSSIVFAAPGLRGTLKGARSLFGATVPTDLVLNVEATDGTFAPAGTPKAKMTKEERAAARAAMTPQDKAKRAADIAKRAADRAAKLAAAAGL